MSGVAYCGLPPSPGTTAWNLDPVLILALVIVSLVYSRGARADRLGLTRVEQASFYSGWLVISVALISPLCNLSVALFLARVVQHMLILFIGVPLLVIGRFDDAIWNGIGGRRSRAVSMLEVGIGPSLFALALWVWHLGRPYDLTLQNTAVYWLMHVSLFLTAQSAWRAIIRPTPLAGILVSFFTGLQMSMLGALLFLSPSPWFNAHINTTAPWGFSPIEDQQLGGLIMWVLGGLLLTAHSTAAIGFYLYRMEAQDRPVTLMQSR
jgi:putative membrane protein